MMAAYAWASAGPLKTRSHAMPVHKMCSPLMVAIHHREHVPAIRSHCKQQLGRCGMCSKALQLPHLRTLLAVLRLLAALRTLLAHL